MSASSVRVGVLVAAVAALALATPAHGVPSGPTGATLAGATLTWTDTSSTENGFVVERCDASISCTGWATIGWVPRNVTAYTDDLRPSTPSRLLYRVRAFDHTGYSSPSNEAEYTSPLGAAVYYAPPVLSVDPADPNLVHADASELNPPYYVSDGQGGLVAVQAPTRWGFGDGATTQTDAPRVDHAYDVAGTYALAAGGMRPSFSGIASANVTVPGNPVTKPVSLRATSVTRSSVALSWVSFPTAATSLEVWRCTGTSSCSAPASRVGSLSAGSTSYTVTKLKAGTAYRVWVRGVSATRASSSDVITVTTGR